MRERKERERVSVLFRNMRVEDHVCTIRKRVSRETNEKE